jgi:hypothetical protein
MRPKGTQAGRSRHTGPSKRAETENAHLAASLGGAFVLGGLRSCRRAGNHREDAGVTSESFGSVEQIELRNAFRVDDHVSPDFGESAGLFKFDVESLCFIGEASSFAPVRSGLRSVVAAARGIAGSVARHRIGEFRC